MKINFRHSVGFCSIGPIAAKTGRESGTRVILRLRLPAALLKRTRMAQPSA
jgi:hypothetical protein